MAAGPLVGILLMLPVNQDEGKVSAWGQHLVWRQV